MARGIGTCRRCIWCWPAAARSSLVRPARAVVGLFGGRRMGRAGRHHSAIAVIVLIHQLTGLGRAGGGVDRHLLGAVGPPQAVKIGLRQGLPSRRRGRRIRPVAIAAEDARSVGIKRLLRPCVGKSRPKTGSISPVCPGRSGCLLGLHFGSFPRWYRRRAWLRWFSGPSPLARLATEGSAAPPVPAHPGDAQVTTGGHMPTESP